MENTNFQSPAHRQLVLYGTQGCHLCDLALKVTQGAVQQLAIPVELTECDIAEDEDAYALYSLKIPVLLRTDIARRLCWPFTENEVITLLLE